MCICVCSRVEGRDQPRVSVPRHSPCRVGTCLSPPLQHWDCNHTSQQPAFPWPLRTGQAPQAPQAHVVSTSQTEPLSPELHCLPLFLHSLGEPAFRTAYTLVYILILGCISHSTKESNLTVADEINPELSNCVSWICLNKFLLSPLRKRFC